MAEPILRQWSILQLIPIHPRWTIASDLAQQLRDREMGTTKRTVERDLVKLEQLFRLQCDDSSQPYRWSFPRQTTIRSIPGMDVVTALTFHLTDEFVSGLIPPEARRHLDPYLTQARNVLHEAGREELAEWTSRVVIIPPGQRMTAPDVPQEVLDNVYEGVLRQKRLSLRYRPRTRSGELKEHPAASPLGLVVRANVTYLVCHLHKGPDPSHLALHRIEHVELLDEPADPPDRFDLHEYVAAGFFDYPVGKAIQLRARFHPDTATHLLECPLNESQTARFESAGWLRLKARVQDTHQLRWWLLGFGPRVEVLAPKSLRQTMAEELEAAARLYADAS